MNTIIDAEAARLAGLQIDTLQKVLSGQITLDQWKWFNNLSADDREALFGDRKKLEPTAPAEPVEKFAPLADSIIRVDRSVRPTYPHWAKGVLHLELEGTGLVEYNIDAVELWLHNKQEDGKLIKGQEIYDHLEANNMLYECLGLSDLLAIQAKGVAFFRKHFAGKTVFGWKSAVRGCCDDVYVSCLHEYSDEVVLKWYLLDNFWPGNYPAARHAK